MSNPPLPPEILDYIVDNLHDEPEALQNCSLVTKSWVPRTRKHLFADITFSSPKRLESWKRTFPDPSSSPAYHTHTLSVQCLQVVTMADAEEGGWIRAFSRVVRLEVDNSVENLDDLELTLAPFHVFSPTLRSLCVVSIILPLSQILGLIHSLPLLEDLTLDTRSILNDDDPVVGGPPTAIPPPSSPPFTGTLYLDLLISMEPAARRLLDLPNGLRFRHITLSWLRGDDLPWINALVVECSDTLESINVSRRLFGVSIKPSIDLSRATRLKVAQFDCGNLSVQWIVVALQTITSEHKDLRQISICFSCDITLDGPSANIRENIGEAASEQWLDLDRLLIRFWESHSIRPEISYPYGSRDGPKEVLDCLLPEIMKREIADLVEW